MKLQVKFHGRITGSIGIDYDMETVVEVPDNATFEDVRLKLYEKHEHIKLDKRDIWFEGTNERPFA